MHETAFQKAYNDGAEFSWKGKSLTQDEIQKYNAECFIEICNKIKSEVAKALPNVKDPYEEPERAGIRAWQHYKIINKIINNTLLNNGISPSSTAAEAETRLQTSFIKGYLEHQEIPDDNYHEFEISVKGGEQPISDWIYSLLQVKDRRSKSAESNGMPQDELLRLYFKIHNDSSLLAIFTSKDADLAEDRWVTMKRYGRVIRVDLKDKSYFGDKVVIGGSYEFVKYFARNQENYEVHHLIPVKLLVMTGILDRLKGPSIKIEKQDHEKTRSYKNNHMLDDMYFQTQRDYLKAKNIRAAVEMEIADIQEKFGSKYDDAIREVREYVAKLETQLNK